MFYHLMLLHGNGIYFTYAGQVVGLGTETHLTANKTPALVAPEHRNTVPVFDHHQPGSLEVSEGEVSRAIWTRFHWNQLRDFLDKPHL